MNTYEYNGKRWRAWSVMECRNPSPHTPHAWNGEFTIYGPYMCWGTHGGPKHRASDRNG